MYDGENRKKNELRTRMQFSTDVTYQDWMRVFCEIRTNYTNLDSPGPVDDDGDISRVETALIYNF